ncbi:hypothetical protein DFH09DRAFT_1000142 [Mycena vulgaris]|nr:hypothetical protein DFH09DRAFT_1000142 [Mycena vulgaris]
MPFPLSVCSFGMPAYYAPCAAEKLKNVEYAEELLYPDFSIREPYFARKQHRQKWRTFVQAAEDFDRASLHSAWLHYKGQTGQNYVFRDVRYTTPFVADSWSPQACMSPLVETSPIQPISNADRSASKNLLPVALIALSPDSFSFQHFLDRVAHILVQGHHLHPHSQSQTQSNPNPTSNSTVPYVLTGEDMGDKTVIELWRQMGYSADHVLHEQATIAAERLIFSCRAVMVHPWLSLRTLELMGVPRSSPSSNRNKVVYMSRSHGGALNGGRRVVNEDAVLHGITALLEERGRGEQLVMFTAATFGNVSHLLEWFTENVIAVVGPHGGAMINHRWAPNSTLVLEFLPANKIALMIYEEASLLSQTYAAIIAQPVTPAKPIKGVDDDMEVDVRDVVSLLRAHLGVVEREDPLRRRYGWPAKELGF